MAKRPASRPKTPDLTTPAAPKPKRTRAAAPRTPEPRAAVPAEPSADDIRRRAYERYLERGGNHGRHFDDWLEAEKELKSRK
jgi:hypothetical protein